MGIVAKWTPKGLFFGLFALGTNCARANGMPCQNRGKLKHLKNDFEIAFSGMVSKYVTVFWYWKNKGLYLQGFNFGIAIALYKARNGGKKKMEKPKYLLGTSVKIEKSNHSGKGYLTTIMYLSPSDSSNIINVCPFATMQCKKLCLVTSSFHMNMNASVKARLDRTNFYKFDREGFKTLLYKNIKKHIRKAESLGLAPVVRLNGTSDLPWETIFPDMFSDFSNVIFYDYTKYPMNKRQNLPSNYYLLRSHSEDNHGDLTAMIQRGNVAVVFDTKKGKALPEKWNGIQVFDGDLDDLRFLDPSNVIVGLRAKGKAKKETATATGFVVAA